MKWEDIKQVTEVDKLWKKLIRMILTQHPTANSIKDLGSKRRRKRRKWSTKRKAENDK